MKLRASIKWVGWVTGVLMLVAAIKLGIYLRTRLPAPVVGLDVLQFEQEETNLFAVCLLKNQGSVRLWSDPFDWQIEAEINGQWSTNNPEFRLSWYDWYLQPGSNRIFAVPVPTNATRWRVVRYYQYMKHPSLRWDYVDALRDRNKANRFDEWACYAFGQFDSDPDEIDKVVSQYITNASMPLPIKLDGLGSKSSVASQPSR